MGDERVEQLPDELRLAMKWDDIKRYYKQRITENASLRAEVALMTEFAKTQQQLAADLENTLVKENAQLIEARAEVELLHQANKEHLVIAEKLNSECQRNEYLAEQVARLEKERDEAMRGLESLTPGGSEYVGDVKRCVETVRAGRSGQMEALRKFAKRAEAAEARIRELEEK